MDLQQLDTVVQVLDDSLKGTEGGTQPVRDVPTLGEEKGDAPMVLRDATKVVLSATEWALLQVKSDT